MKHALVSGETANVGSWDGTQMHSWPWQTDQLHHMLACKQTHFLVAFTDIKGSKRLEFENFIAAPSAKLMRASHCHINSAASFLKPYMEDASDRIPIEDSECTAGKAVAEVDAPGRCTHKCVPRNGEICIPCRGFSKEEPPPPLSRPALTPEKIEAMTPEELEAIRVPRCDGRSLRSIAECQP